MQRRVVSLWFPRLAAERSLRVRPLSACEDVPFALSIFERNSERIYDLNPRGEVRGLDRGMTTVQARSLCPELVTRPADLKADQRFLSALARWATRYCPWVGTYERDGLFLDITGSDHLFGGEEALVEDMRERLSRSRLSPCIGLADTPGAAWALSHFAEGIAAPDRSLSAIAELPVAGLRLSQETCNSLKRLGIATIRDLHNLPRATLSRRYDREVLQRLDQALGNMSEQISPIKEDPLFAVRLTLPDPIGLLGDVMAGVGRLMTHLCERLDKHQKGARVLRLTFRKVDQDSESVDLKLARPMSDPKRLLTLFERAVEAVDAGYGIDMIRLEAVQVEAVSMRQMETVVASGSFPGQETTTDRLDDLITQLGSRVGLENILRFCPQDSHIPERSFSLVPAAYNRPAKSWPHHRPRPVRLFPPEPVTLPGRHQNNLNVQTDLKDQERRFAPPASFRWRGRLLSLALAQGPERIAPLWWDVDDSWGQGLRDYWQVDTRQGHRLWLFHTPQNPGWFVQGEFA
ncbi:MAG: DNA polymerase Y family protein [Rhodobacteraceae bacterium]|nr:DNA polymerase Y family protein [Paracoccaceae bacterium]